MCRLLSAVCCCAQFINNLTTVWAFLLVYFQTRQDFEDKWLFRYIYYHNVQFVCYIQNANFSKTDWLVFYLPLKMFFLHYAKLAPGHLNCPVVPIYIVLVIEMRSVVTMYLFYVLWFNNCANFELMSFLASSFQWLLKMPSCKATKNSTYRRCLHFTDRVFDKEF